MKSFLSFLENRRSSLICSLSMVLAIAISSIAVFLDFVSSLGVYLAIPVVLAGWYGSKRAGLILAVVSSGCLIYSNHFDESLNSFIAGQLRLGVMHLIAYVILAVIITKFRGFHREEKQAADTDKLTGVLNHRGFYAEFANEIIRSARYGHAFSLAYIDIDDFKSLNDKYGHNFGDEVLTRTANVLQSSLRSTDSVSRLGGDEFACLLPETGYEEANTALMKVRDELSSHIGGPSIVARYSIGLVTFDSPPDDVKEALEVADNMMYSVKRNKKNDMSSRIWNKAAR